MGRNDTVSIFVIDDNSFALDSVRFILGREGYDVVGCKDGEDALGMFREKRFDAVLTDIRMPKTSGMDLLERFRDINSEVPVILMTASPELSIAINAVKKGAFDFIIKPFEPKYLSLTVKKAVDHYRLLQMEKNYKVQLEEEVSKRTQELADALDAVKTLSMDTLYRLTVVSEFRDTDTGAHTKRIGAYAGRLAKVLGMSPDFVETITFASALHDIGKIGVPDNVLLKPGSLTPEEYERMKAHTTMGEKMLFGSSQPELRMAASIALTHHERWDGTGYPNGLKGEAIPVEGRLVMLVDVYDALRSKRPYKNHLSHEEVLRIIKDGDGRTMPGDFDPVVLSAFLDTASDLAGIYETYHD